MKIFVGHNFYQQAGGEDLVFRSQTKMLETFGHEVYRYERRNDEIRPGLISRLSHTMSLRFSRPSYDEVRRLLRAFKPDVAHFHNTFFVMTPSVFSACRDAGVPVVVSLHNYRLMCVNGLFFRDHHACEDCLQTSRWAGIKHACYRGSFLSSLALTDMISHHWRANTWTQGIDRILVATEFSREKHIRAGIPEDNIKVLPHFVEEPEHLAGADRGDYALYAGRLSDEKGVDLLLMAWRTIKDIPLYIVGTGPRREAMEQFIEREGLTNVRMFGFLKREEYLKIMREAKFLVAPCLSYDNFPMVVVEAYSYGVPVLASRLGSLEEAVQDGVTGLLFSNADAEDIGRKARALISDHQRYQSFCFNARKAYESRYSPKQHHQTLMAYYQECL